MMMLVFQVVIPLVSTYKSPWHQNPEQWSHFHHNENLRSHIMTTMFTCVNTDLWTFQIFKTYLTKMHSSQHNSYVWNKFDKILLGQKPCQFWTEAQCFHRHLHLSLMMEVKMSLKHWPSVQSWHSLLPKRIL